MAWKNNEEINLINLKINLLFKNTYEWIERGFFKKMYTTREGLLKCNS